MLSLPIWQQKGGVSLAILVSFLISVMASVVGYYISKWLDGDDSDNLSRFSMISTFILVCVNVK